MQRGLRRASSTAHLWREKLVVFPASKVRIQCCLLLHILDDPARGSGKCPYWSAILGFVYGQFRVRREKLIICHAARGRPGQYMLDLEIECCLFCLSVGKYQLFVLRILHVIKLRALGHEWYLATMDVSVSETCNGGGGRLRS